MVSSSAIIGLSYQTRFDVWENGTAEVGRTTGRKREACAAGGRGGKDSCACGREKVRGAEILRGVWTARSRNSRRSRVVQASIRCRGT